MSELLSLLGGVLFIRGDFGGSLKCISLLRYKKLWFVKDTTYCLCVDSFYSTRGTE